MTIFEAAFWRRQTSEENAESKGKQTADQVAPLLELAGPTTEGVLSLNTAIESRRQTADQVESQLTEAEIQK